MCVYVCPEGYYIQNLTDDWRCVDNCSEVDPDLYIDYVSKICVTQCPDGTYSYSTNQCLTNCPDGSFADPDNHKCDVDCNNTNNGYYADPTTNMCVPQCPFGYFGDDSTGPKLCEQECLDAA